jgi:hypothetical protein
LHAFGSNGGHIGVVQTTTLSDCHSLLLQLSSWAPSFGIWAKRRKLWLTEKTIDSPEFFGSENKSWNQKSTCFINI